MPDERPNKFHWRPDAASLRHELIDAVTSGLEMLSEGFGEPAYGHMVVRHNHVVRAANLLIKKEFLPETLRTELSTVSGELFLSYSTEDEAWAREFASDLESEGLTTFLACRSIAAGNDWDQEIWEAVRRCDIFVALLTVTAVKSEWCLLEAGAARGLGKQVIPVLRHLSPDSLPNALAMFQAREVQSREQQRQLIQELKAKPPR